MIIIKLIEIIFLEKMYSFCFGNYVEVLKYYIGVLKELFRIILNVKNQMKNIKL